MQNILIWIDSSIKIKSKIIKLNNALRIEFNNILFVTKDEKIAKIYRSLSINCISIEKSFNRFFEYDQITMLKTRKVKIDKLLLSNIFHLAYYKDSYLNNIYSLNNFDQTIELSLFDIFWKGLIEEKNITHILNLNGLSIPSFSLANVSYNKKLKLLFWENGLLPNSLFINKVGVNAFSNIEEEIINNSEENYNCSNIVSLLKDIGIKNYRNRVKVLVTLQVDNDSNVKLFSPFLGMKEFVSFIINQISTNNANIIFRLRKHPKTKFATVKKFRNFKNISFSNDSLNNDFKWCDLVLTLNSTTGIESIIYGKPVICFGNSYYSKFLRKYKFLNIKNSIYFYVYDPKNSEDIKIRQNILNNLNKFTIYIEDKDKDWANKILQNFKKDIKPFFLNKSLMQYIFVNKYIKIKSKPKNNFLKLISFILKKLIFSLMNLYEILFNND